MASSSRPTIYGPDGRPVRLPGRELVRRTAPPQPSGWRRAQSWGSAVGDLTPDRLRTIYRSVAAGVWSPEYIEAAEEVEERDAHYRGVLQQRRLASLDATIGVAAASPALADQRLADEVRTHVVEGPGWHDLCFHLLDALGKGYASVEIVWALRAGRWRPAQYLRIDPRWIVWADDGETPLLLRSSPDGGRPLMAAGGPAGAAGALADPLVPGKLLLHVHRSKSGLPARGGLAFTVTSLWLLKSVAVRGWWSYADIFGLPSRVGRYGQNATEDDVQTLVSAIEMLAVAAGCVIPDTMEIEQQPAAGSAGGSGGGAVLFPGMADWCDRQTSKAVVGATMTADDGSSLSQSQTHLKVRNDLVRDDVRQLCATITDTVVKWYCELNHAPRPAGWPRVELPDAPPTLAEVLEASRAGLQVPSTWLRERMGIPEPAEGEEVVTATPAAAPAPTLHAGPPPAGRPVWDVVDDVAGALGAADDPDDLLIGGGASADALAARGEALGLLAFEARALADGEREDG